MKNVASSCAASLAALFVLACGAPEPDEESLGSLELALGAAAGQPFGYVRTDGKPAVMTRGTDNHVHELALVDGVWLAFDLSAATGAPAAQGDPVAYQQPGVFGVPSSTVLYRSNSNQITELELTGNVWSDSVLLAAAPAAASNPYAYVRPGSIPTVLYRSTSNDIIELTNTNPLFTGWTFGNLTAGAGGSPPKASGDPFGYVRPGNIPTIVYRSTTNQINELRLSGVAWVNGNLSSVSGAPAASGDPMGYVRSDGIPAVVFRSTTSIIELALVGGFWNNGNLSSLASGEPSAAGDPFAYVRHDGVTAVVYRGTNNRIVELALVGGTWQFGDLSAITGAPAAASDPMAYRRSSTVSSVVYRGTDNEVYEIFLTGGTWGVGVIS